MKGDYSPGVDDATVRWWRQIAGDGRLDERVRRVHPHVERLFDAYLGEYEPMTNAKLRRRWQAHFADRRRRDVT